MTVDFDDRFLQQMIDRFHFEIRAGDLLAAESVLISLIGAMRHLRIPCDCALEVRGQLDRLADWSAGARQDAAECAQLLQALLDMPLVDRRYLH